MRRLTMCLAYYCNAKMLSLQLDMLAALPAEIRDQLAVIVVDDGSPDGDAQGREIGCHLSVFKIGVDVRWNQDAAKNIAVHESQTDWLLLTDIDHLVPCETFTAILREKLDKSAVYRFSRVTLEDAGPNFHTTEYKPHPNSWLMTRAMYEQIGGYDERFAGLYGTDSDFRDRVAKEARVVMRKDVLVRVPRTTVADASTTTYLRKTPEDADGIPRIKRERSAIPDWKPLRLSFAYHRLYP